MLLLLGGRSIKTYSVWKWLLSEGVHSVYDLRLGNAVIFQGFMKSLCLRLKRSVSQSPTNNATYYRYSLCDSSPNILVSNLSPKLPRNYFHRLRNNLLGQDLSCHPHGSFIGYPFCMFFDIRQCSIAKLIIRFYPHNPYRSPRWFTPQNFYPPLVSNCPVPNMEPT